MVMSLVRRASMSTMTEDRSLKAAKRTLASCVQTGRPWFNRQGLPSQLKYVVLYHTRTGAGACRNWRIFVPFALSNIQGSRLYHAAINSSGTDDTMIRK